MKRLRVMLLFLLLGTAISVAVAWGYAAAFEHRRFFGFNIVPEEASHWQGVTAIAAEFDRRRDPPAWSRDFTVHGGYVPEPISDWSMLNEPAPNDARHLFEIAAGWPRVCLFWRIDVRTADRLLSTDYPQGAIEGHLPSSVFFSNGQDVIWLPATPIADNLLVDSVFWGAVVFVICLAVQLMKRVKWNHRRRQRRCTACGYSLADTEHEICPECGTSVSDAPALVTMPRGSRLAWALLVLVVAEGLFVFLFVTGNRDQALLSAAYEGDNRKLEKLLGRGVDPDVMRPVQFAETALMVASAKGRQDAVRILIEAGAGLDAGGGLTGRSALHYAAGGGHVDVIRLLCDAGADVDVLNSKDQTPLHYAARWGDRDAAEALLEHGADIHAKDFVDLTAMHTAADNGDLELVKLLERHGAMIDAKDDSNQTPIFYAVYAGRIEIAEYLLDRGADIGITTVERQNFWCKIDEVLKSDKLTQALIASKADVNQITNGGSTPLIFAVSHETTDAVRFLLEHGADVNLSNEPGLTALMWAAAGGTKDMVRFLLEHGADPMMRDEDGKTALNRATPENRKIISTAINSADGNRDE